MMIKKVITIFVTCLAVITGIVWYKAYLPLSEKIEDPRSKILPFVLQFTELLSYTGNILNKVPMINIFRFLLISLDWDWIDFEHGQWKKGVEIEDTTVNGVPVIIFRPNMNMVQTPIPPALIHFHGGGFTFGSPKYKSFMATCILIANGTKSVVISVDYRLAPENIFPSQFDDAYAVVSKVINEPSMFGIDGNKIALIGDSAGGLLAAAISLEFAKITIHRNIVAQVLIYPWLQSIDIICLPSYKKYKQGFSLSDKTMAFFASAVTMGNKDMIPQYLNGNVSQYFMQTPYWKYLAEISNCKIPNKNSAIINLPSEFIKKVTDPRMSPLLANDLSGLPPTFIALAEYDVVASEGTLFAKRLKEVDVPVIKKQYKTYHAFIQNVGLPIANGTLAKLAVNDIVNYLNKVFYK